MQAEYLTGPVEIKTSLKVYGLRFLIINAILQNFTML
jgi:hypothetical protein